MTTKQEILDQIKILQAKADALPEDKPKGRFKPEVGEVYQCNGVDGFSYNSCWGGCGQDVARLATGNVFRTEEEAQRHVENLKTHYELMDWADFVPDWSDEDSEKYALSCLRQGEGVGTSVWWGQRHANTVYFRSEEEALAAVDKVGKDRVIAYLKGE